MRMNESNYAQLLFEQLLSSNNWRREYAKNEGIKQKVL